VTIRERKNQLLFERKGKKNFWRGGQEEVLSDRKKKGGKLLGKGRNEKSEKESRNSRGSGRERKGRGIIYGGKAGKAPIPL